MRIHKEMVNSANIKDILAGYDFIIDGTDNFPAKFLMNDACVLLKKPFSHAGILRFYGQTFTILPGESACYRCLFLAPPPVGSVPSCGESGVIGAMAGVIGALQAMEAIKYLLGAGDLLTNRLLTFVALPLNFREIAIKKNASCPVCGEHPTITSLTDYEQKACGLRK